MQKKSENKKLAVDTSALISLAVGSKLEECLKEFDLVITEGVKDELEDVSDYSDKHAFGAELVLEKIAKERSWEGAALFRYAKKYIEDL